MIDKNNIPNILVILERRKEYLEKELKDIEERINKIKQGEVKNNGF